jgi:hypothetical protein
MFRDDCAFTAPMMLSAFDRIERLLILMDHGECNL